MQSQEVYRSQYVTIVSMQLHKAHWHQSVANIHGIHIHKPQCNNLDELPGHLQHRHKHLQPKTLTPFISSASLLALAFLFGPTSNSASNNPLWPGKGLSLFACLSCGRCSLGRGRSGLGELPWSLLSIPAPCIQGNMMEYGYPQLLSSLLNTSQWKQLVRKCPALVPAA